MAINWERWARGAGIGFVLFAVLAFTLLWILVTSVVLVRSAPGAAAS